MEVVPHRVVIGDGAYAGHKIRVSVALAYCGEACFVRPFLDLRPDILRSAGYDVTEYIVSDLVKLGNGQTPVDGLPVDRRADSIPGIVQAEDTPVVSLQQRTIRQEHDASRISVRRASQRTQSAHIPFSRRYFGTIADDRLGVAGNGVFAGVNPEKTSHIIGNTTVSVIKPTWKKECLFNVPADIDDVEVRGINRQ